MYVCVCVCKKKKNTMHLEKEIIILSKQCKPSYTPPPSAPILPQTHTQNPNHPINHSIAPLKITPPPILPPPVQNLLPSPV